MTPAEFVFRVLGIWTAIVLAVWSVSLAITFIVEDASGKLAALNPDQSATVVLSCVFSVIGLVAAILNTLFKSDDIKRANKK